MEFLVAWHGTRPPAQLPGGNGIAWIYGFGGIQYGTAQNPKLDVRTYVAAEAFDQSRSQPPMPSIGEGLLPRRKSTLESAEAPLTRIIARR
jgi:hypothetical protein